jgi:signal transduction histidine kinase/ligand-binding sensor domain-containing protein
MALAAASAEHLPIRFYTTADGLPSNSVYCLVRDSRGFMWFCTSEGLSRYDGYGFTNYGVDQGLPDDGVIHFLETRDGEYWVATASGISRFLPGISLETDQTGGKSRRFFDVYRLEPNEYFNRWPLQLAEAPDGRIWCLTTDGLYRLDRTRKQFEAIETGALSGYTSLFQERDGSLWLGDVAALYRRLPDGRKELYHKAEGLPVSQDGLVGVHAILRDRDERLWIATSNGLCRMSAHPAPGKASVERVYTRRDGLTDDVVVSLFQSRDGTIWVATQYGLSRFVPGLGKTADRFRSYTPRRGLDLPGVDANFAHFAEDNRNNLWIGGFGAKRLALSGFTVYTVEDGLATNNVQSLFEDREGRLIAVTGYPWTFNVFNSERFLPIVPRVPKDIIRANWGHWQIQFQDHAGAWWVPAGKQGLCRYPRVRHIEDLAHTLPEKVFTERDGLPGWGYACALFEDSRGDVWISTRAPNSLVRWSRADGLIHNFRPAQGGMQVWKAFAEDRAGNVWISLSIHHVTRYREGRFEVFTPAEGLPEGEVTSLFLDHAGRLWLGSSRGGLARVDDPTAVRPRFSVYTTRSGLASNSILCITEDAWGRIYAAGRGIDRLDPETGRVRHFGEADGLRFSTPPQVAYRDRYGALWFGATRLMPTQEEPPPPAIRITRLRVRGVERPISEMGESRIEGLRLRPTENQVQVEFGSLNFEVGETIRYQYKLEGTERDWAPPADSHSVNYAVLSPGSYRFLVRAVNTEGVASPAPASLEFTILPPFWLRWWFWTAAVIALALAAVSAHRYRLRHALALERVRTRIATDLHDDIGSSLTQIAILSEVVRRHMETDAAQAAPPLLRIADISRELVDSMSDIVWAINPRRDHLGDLTYRMRRFASDILPARNIEFDFQVPAAAEDTALGAEVRRQVFLVFKECVNNIVRHSGCRRAEFGLKVQQHRLLLWVHDDGKGLSVPGNGHGHGLASMEQRIRSLGGEWKISSEPGHGTAVSVSVPLGHDSSPKTLRK